MRFFVDISVVSENQVVVIEKKFIMTKINNGHEADSFNIHNKELNYKEISTVLFSNERWNFIGTSAGVIICIDNENIGNNMLINCRQSATITAVKKI